MPRPKIIGREGRSEGWEQDIATGDKSFAALEASSEAKFGACKWGHHTICTKSYAKDCAGGNESGI
jgi:hypothetical protein